MSLRVIKVRHSRWRCAYVLPVFSQGKNGAGVIVGEEQCRLLKGHAGPHSGSHGQVVVNAEDMDKALHGAPKKIWTPT